MRWILAAAISLTACGGSDPSTCLPDCEANRDYDAIAYHLHGSLDWNGRELAAVEDITVRLAGSPVIELDARVDFERTLAADGVDLASDFDEERGLLRVDLTPLAAANPGGELTFSVAYTAPASRALVFAGARDDDPVRSRVAYTNSEPIEARNWLISNDHPTDRARFSVEFVMTGSDHDLVANGERLAAGPGIVRYAMAQPLPTYLMAFAAGDLEHAERTSGRVPLAVWHRRGATVDTAAHLDVIERQLAQFESLVGPYPFDRYAVVLLPGFPGGMENATITFNSETSGVGAINEGLNAHELAHHWFGDWVTMRDYRDVWIKEGLATLLAAEATRPVRDTEARGRLFGAFFNFNPSDAVVDDTLYGLDRYTSGPYERSAWMMTQVRARVGEAAFWATLREVLAAHPLGDIDGESFVRAFAPELDDAAIAQWLAALPVAGVPGIAIAADGQRVTMTLSDPSRFLLDPISITTIDAAGAATPHLLAPGAQLAIDVPAGGYLATDEADRHPHWPFTFDVSFEDYFKLAPFVFPSEAAARTAFETRSAATQERALDDGFPAIDAGGLRATHAALDSSGARSTLVSNACLALSFLPEGDPGAPPLIEALVPLLVAPALRGVSFDVAPCAAVMPATTLRAELAALSALGADIPASSLARLEYLMSLDHGAADMLALLAPIATTSPSVRHRDLAILRLARQTFGIYSGVPDGDRPAYRQFFRDRLAGITSAARLFAVWQGIVEMVAVEALPDVAELLHEVSLSGGGQLQIICQAFQIAGPADWAAFQEAAQPWAELAPQAAAALADPSTCDQ